MVLTFFYLSLALMLLGVPVFGELYMLTIRGIMQITDVQMQLNKGTEAKQNTAFLDAGGEIYVPTDEDMETFRSLKEPMRDWYVDQFGIEW